MAFPALFGRPGPGGVHRDRVCFGRGYLRRVDFGRGDLGRGYFRRWRSATVLAIAAAALTGCTVTAGSAVVLDGRAVPEVSVQHDTAAYLAANPPAQPVSDSERAALNRAQITFRIRHALIAKAVAGQHISVTEAQVRQAQAQVAAQGPQGGLVGQLGLPQSAEPDVVYDVVALQALVKALPAAGVRVQDVSVTTEGVAAANRTDAVSLRAKYLAHPAAMDAAVQAAGQNGVSKKVYRLLEVPGAGAAGLYRPASDQTILVPKTDGYYVLRTTGRSVVSTPLTPAVFNNAKTLSDVFNLGAVLVSKYQSDTAIAVNPRYGVWDPASVQVVPGNDGL